VAWRFVPKLVADLRPRRRYHTRAEVRDGAGLDGRRLLDRHRKVTVDVDGDVTFDLALAGAPQAVDAREGGYGAVVRSGRR
jgi:hypothetical protein